MRSIEELVEVAQSENDEEKERNVINRAKQILKSIASTQATLAEYQRQLKELSY